MIAEEIVEELEVAIAGLEGIEDRLLDLQIESEEPIDATPLLMAMEFLEEFYERIKT